MKKSRLFDVVIVGAGPSGCTCAYQLAESGLSVAVIEKDVFPRDKVCGDALSADVINQFYRMDNTIAEAFLKRNPKKVSNGVRFFAPNYKSLDIPFTNPKHKDAAGFVMKRLDFDSFFAEQIKGLSNIEFIENQKVKAIDTKEDSVFIETSLSTFQTKLIIGADGANSIVNRKLNNNKLNKKHHSGGLRQYFENVTGLDDTGFIELHFYKEILPGYFWVFPLPGNKANVGLGILSSEISKQNINLKEKFTHLINNHPNLKDRFKKAKPLETIKGFGLPLGSKKKPLSGNRFLLLGDAANLIDPFTGEGIGNAIRSGRFAATHIKEAFKTNRFDADFNKKYDIKIYQAMWNELRVSKSLQNLLKYPWLFNFLVKKANKNKSVQLLLTSMLDDVDLKKELVKPSFYVKLLFNF
ncbi:geranylgeranyl reductase family protein [Marixanthomonas ophiurae]|uniref:Geranylgeranyl reductase family protein n=1 Tax=Marixanthomonas ophiurae TaxID=387659 RepID=A0A3E1Q8D2_9FLAO|nr:geranylgeranyl reductase family protein [Marixanthomonas ophiurae]RFN58382.1 geranylgeranyl reductase family protein [Marixanthomonas ophiurae]